MKNNESRTKQIWLTHRTARGPRTSLIMLIAIAAVATCGTLSAQTLIGTSGAGWQTWTPSIDLNDSGAPYWDVPWGASGNYGGAFAEKNVGWCLTSSGDCQGIGSAMFAPGAIPFWGMSYSSATDTGGARDPKVYFKSNVRSTSMLSSGSPTMQTLQAILFLNSSANPIEINEFGWFETTASGCTVGTRHILFQGSGEPTGSLTPDPAGKTVLFTPTQYFGFYYSDVSEPACPDGTSRPCTTPGPLHGCYAYTLFLLDDPRCTESGGQQGDHDFVVFNQNPGSSYTTYWVVAEDPAGCPMQDGDCNLTIVKVSSNNRD